MLGCLYIPMTSLEDELNFALTDSAVYNYRLFDVGRERHTYYEMTFSEVIKAEKWTHISLQQLSSYSGLYDTLSPYITPFLELINEYLPSDKTLMWHQTWAYQQDYNNEYFEEFYDNNQLVMYQDIVDTSKQVMENFPFDLLLPSGTAIQNARTSYLGDTLTRDGRHLDLNIGRFITACAFFEVLTGLDIDDTTFAPSGVDQDAKKIAHAAAHAANLSPYFITDLSTINQ